MSASELSSTGRGRNFVRERLSPTDWKADARCHARAREIEATEGTEATRRFWDLFFPDRATTNAEQDEALALCGVCPVRYECLAWALTEREPHGIWGGEIERTRRATLREAKRSFHDTIASKGRGEVNTRWDYASVLRWVKKGRGRWPIA